jgi:UDP-N-acetyl-D-glucosamine dehydrogenase
MKIVADKMGIDIHEVIRAAATKPFGFVPYYPGPGIGGHCIPIDPFYLTWIARKHQMATRFIELAGEINTSMPHYVVQKVADALNDQGRSLKGSRVLLLGMAYKRDADDPRESPGFELWDTFVRKGALVSYNDPFIPQLPPMRKYPHLAHGIASQTLTPDYLRSQDCVLVVTDHSTYDWRMIAQYAPLIVDTRNATAGLRDHRDKIVGA